MCAISKEWVAVTALLSVLCKKAVVCTGKVEQ